MTRDLLQMEEVKRLVRDAYRDVPASTAAVARRLYAADELAAVPEVAVNRSLGVANHLRHADIRPGETVLDIGCGAGIDTILAARRTGPDGLVIALDFLPEMLERTQEAVRAAGLANVRLVEGEMEALPLADDSVDLVISNGVVNLSARKARVMAECARVLRPGGRLCIADLTVEQDDLPPRIATHPTAWAGCLAGALSEAAMIHKLSRAGFRAVRVVHREPLGVDECALYPLFSAEVLGLMRDLPPERRRRLAVAIVVTAELPAADDRAP
ncbi:methyltransferase domain-containing protein [Georgenia sp. AZ-5]|uniref:methyltransferase domain-containing protein n=1 Tax=Georgenia sp. AZ-5 TaxID=3367526 RepID=UPI003753F09B